jgi:hypothetical protein
LSDLRKELLATEIAGAGSFQFVGSDIIDKDPPINNNVSGGKGSIVRGDTILDGPRSGELESNVNNRSSRVIEAELSQAADMSDSLMTDPELLLLLIRRVWQVTVDDNQRSEEEGGGKGEGENAIDGKDKTLSTRSLSMRVASAPQQMSGFQPRKWALWCWKILTSYKEQNILARFITGESVYKYILAAMVFLTAVLEIYMIQISQIEESSESSAAAIGQVQTILQVAFTVDICLKLVAAYPALRHYFQDRWNLFDVIVIIVTWIPVFTHAKYIGTR